MQVIVIGAGVVGSAIAYYLSKEGARVTVVERGRVGGGTSGASTAYVNAVLKRPEHYHRFSRLGVEAYDRLEEELGPGSGIGSRGALHWPASMVGGLKTFDRVLAELEEWDYPHEVLNPEQAAEREPNVRVKDHWGPVLHLPNERWVEGTTLAQSLCERAAEMGTQIADSCSVVEITICGGRVSGVDTTEGFVAGDEVVVAAGVSSGGLLAPLGYKLPMARTVGVLAVFKPPKPLLKGVVYPGIYHCRPTEDGGLQIGSDAFDVLADEYTETSHVPSWLYGLRDVAARDIKGLGELEITEFRIGLRPMPEDGLPLIGRVPGVEGVYVAAMHSGITLAAIVGQTVAREIWKGEESGVVGRYGLGRENSAGQPTTLR